jgi:hypothetical protein
MPDARAAELAEEARDDRRTSRTVRDRRLARSFARKAAALEKQYALWCGGRGRTPIRAEVAKARRRKGATAAADQVLGDRQLGQFKCSFGRRSRQPLKLRELAAAAGMTTGQWLDDVLRDANRPQFTQTSRRGY